MVGWDFNYLFVFVKCYYFVIFLLFKKVVKFFKSFFFGYKKVKISLIIYNVYIGYEESFNNNKEN